MSNRARDACTTLHPVYRRLLALTLEELRLLEAHLGHLDQRHRAVMMINGPIENVVASVALISKRRLRITRVSATRILKGPHQPLIGRDLFEPPVLLTSR